MAFTLVPTEVEAFVIADPKDEEAVVISDWSAREPAVKVASVRFLVAYVQTSKAVKVEPDVSVRVPLVHTSATNVPKVVRLLVVADQTAAGIVERSEVEAVRTVALVLALMVLTALAT